MKILKKIISVFSAVSVAFSAVYATALADEKNGFTQAEIDASEVKPTITIESKLLTAEEAKGNEYIEIPVIVSGAQYKYASTGLHIYYDSRLEIAKNTLGFPDVEKGSAIKNLSLLHPEEDPSAAETGMKGIFLVTAGDKITGTDGTMWTLKFALPDDAESGDVFPIDIVYRENKKTSSMFSNVTNNSDGQLMSAYVFTRGICNGVTKQFVPDSDDVSRCPAISELSADVDGYIAIEGNIEHNICGDANCDNIIDLADAVAIFQHIGNEDKYGLSAKGYENSDTNGDGIVTGADAIIIQRIEAGEITVADLPFK